MILNELFGRQTIVEYGKHGFPGFGKGLFTQQHFEYVVSQIANVPDDVLRLDLGQWFCNAFDRDGSNFKAGKFMDWVRENKRSSRSSATFQQRHFYYFAHLIKMEGDPHRREFLTEWMGEMFRRCNPAFKQSLWDKFCTPEPQEEPAMLNEWGGATGFPGYGQNLFTRGHRGAIGEEASRISDTVVRHEIAEWFAAAFGRDAANFDSEGYVKAIDSGGRFTAANPRWQARHFYYLAQLIQNEGDLHKRIYLCHMLTPVFQHNNERFMPSRWEDFCKIPEEHRDWKPENRSRHLDHEDRSERVDRNY